MAQSKIGICNVALAMLGSSAIRSFSEANKRARMCDVMFDSTKDYLLAKFDWPFARQYQKLQPLADVTSPAGMYAYALPQDCVAPRDLAPKGSKERWYVMGRTLFCETPNDGDGPYLFYTRKVTDTAFFTDTFSHLLALVLAIRMGPSITQDKALIRELKQQFSIEQPEVWHSDASMGNDYRRYDEDPDNDSFVYPDGNAPSADEWDNY